MSNHVGSFREKSARHLTPPKVRRRAQPAPLTFAQRFWNSLPSYLAFYIFLVVIAYAAWHGFHRTTVIAPFHLPPEDKSQPLPFGGEAVADAVRGALTSVTNEANGDNPMPPCDFAERMTHASEGRTVARRERQLDINKMPKLPRNSVPVDASKIELGGPVSVEVKGVSPGALRSAAREVLGTETRISGDVLFRTPNKFQLMAHTGDGGPWITKPQETSLDGLRIATCELAEDIIGKTNRNLLAAAWMRRAGVLSQKGQIKDAISEFHRAFDLKPAFDNSELSAVHLSFGQTLLDDGQYPDAFRELQQAAEAGNPLAMASVGWMYENGFGVGSKDQKEAVIWYKRAADAGSADGMANLGYMFQHGYGVDVDYQQALNWYRKAADVGNTWGMIGIGSIYENGGPGITKDLGQATDWYAKAAQLGDQEAEYALKQLAKSGH